MIKTVAQFSITFHGEVDMMGKDGEPDLTTPAQAEELIHDSINLDPMAGVKINGKSISVQIIEIPMGYAG